MNDYKFELTWRDRFALWREEYGQVFFYLIVLPLLSGAFFLAMSLVSKTTAMWSALFLAVGYPLGKFLPGYFRWRDNRRALRK